MNTELGARGGGGEDKEESHRVLALGNLQSRQVMVPSLLEGSRSSVLESGEGDFTKIAALRESFRDGGRPDVRIG